MKKDADILIIGAGFSGLYAAAQLSVAGKQVLLLEARERCGGRVENLLGKSGNVIQGGPEFVHGDLPLTKKLIRRAKVTVAEMEGEMYRSNKGQIFQVKDFAPGLDEFLKKLKALKKDTDLKSFLNTHFKASRYAALRESVTSMAEGFDAADAAKISVMSIYEEWSGDSIESSYTLRESYSQLVKQLTQECLDKGCKILLQKEVKQIDWKNQKVKIYCKDNSRYEAPKAIVTVPLGILTASKQQRGAIRFTPAINEKIKAAKQLGFGPVVKVVMEFGSRIWDNARAAGQVSQVPDLGFLLTNGDFPAFWVSNEGELPLLTAWAGGSRAQKLAHLNNRELKEKAIQALSESLNSSPSFIKEQLLGIHAFNWAKDKFTRGAYSYATPHTRSARAILAEPLNDKLFFAGEALGHTVGTVEAAFESADEVAKKIIALDKR